MSVRDTCIAVCVAAACVSGAAGRAAQIRVDASRQREAVDHYRAGQKMMQVEQFESAAREFSAAVARDPLLALAHYGLGQADMKLKRYREAVAAFTACRQAFRDLQSLATKDQAEADRLRDEEIRELQDSIRRIQSGQIKAGGSQSPLIFGLEARISELERMKLKGLAPDEAPAAVSLALGSAYFRIGELGDAEREYLAAIKALARFGEAHNNLAVVYMMTNRIAEAEKEVALAEAAGYRVDPGLKDEIKRKKGGGT